MPRTAGSVGDKCLDCTKEYGACEECEGELTNAIKLKRENYLQRQREKSKQRYYAMKEKADGIKNLSQKDLGQSAQ